MKPRLVLAACAALLVACSNEQPLPEEAGYDAAVMPIPPYHEYKMVWQALEQVMKRHFLVRVSRYEDGYMVATSEIANQQGALQRLKIVGEVVEDEDGFFEPQIFVLEQIDVSDVKPFLADVQTPNYRWRSMGRNHTAEAELVLEVNRVLQGDRSNPQDGLLFQVKHPHPLPQKAPLPEPGPQGYDLEPETPNQ